MNGDLTESERDMWAATAAHFEPAADAEEKASTRGGLQILALGLVLTCVPIFTGVIALVRYLVRTP